MSDTKTLSRRKALSILGLAAAVGYAAPTVLGVDQAEARRRRRRRTRGRTRGRTRTRTRSS